MDRETRNLGHGKQSRIKSVERPPEYNEGNDGDIQIYNGRLYIKDKNKWHSYSSDSDSTGSVTAFSAEMNGNQTSIGTSLEIVEFDTILYDTVHGFNTSDYKYHVQQDQAGLYLIGADLTIDHSNTGNWAQLEIRHTDISGSEADVWHGFYQGDGITAGEYMTIKKSAMFNLESGDTVYVRVKSQANNLDIQYVSQSLFYGFKIN